jgi:hypothetical protein
VISVFAATREILSFKKSKKKKSVKKMRVFDEFSISSSINISIDESSSLLPKKEPLDLGFFEFTFFIFFQKFIF